MNPDDGYCKFTKIFEKYGEESTIFNEAETRAKIIDTILRECLGWDEELIRREDHVAPGFTDYQLLNRDICALVIEAKKTGIYFEIPTTMHKRSYKIGGSITTDKYLLDAMNQVREYCNNIGCKYAAVWNGYQLILFTAITIGKPWTEGFCTVFHSLKDIKENFSYFWNILSLESVSGGSLLKYLEKGKRDLTFQKWIVNIHNPDVEWARNELYTYIKPISEEIFSELTKAENFEALKYCYVFSRGENDLTQDLKGFFVDKLPYFSQKFKIKEIIEKDIKAGTFQKEYSQRLYDDTKSSLTVIMGGVGCGKSTFLHRFFTIILADHEDNLWFYIDFKAASFDKDKIQEFTLKEIIRQWDTKYETKLKPILEQVGFSIPKEPADVFLQKLFNLLHLSKFSVTIVIDNLDQHDRTFQENLFIFSNHITELLRTVTIVVLREETFIASAITGVFDAYDIPKFHLASPNFLNMIKKRIEFAIKTLKEEKQKKVVRFGNLNILEDLIKYFEIINFSLQIQNKQSKRIVNFIDSVSVGNMRLALQMFKHFLISGNTNIDEVFKKTEEQDQPYQIAYHQFIKSIILGERRYYKQDKSYIINLFDFDDSLSDSHFNFLRILKFLLVRENKKSPLGFRGYVDINELVVSAEDVSISRDIIIDSLLRLSHYNLIEFDNQSKSDISSASFSKITPAGKYYLNSLIYEFAYLDSVIIDTPISDHAFFSQLRYLIHMPELENRITKVDRFVNYLVKAENDEMKDRPQYLNSEFVSCTFAEDIKNRFNTFKNIIEND